MRSDYEILEVAGSDKVAPAEFYCSESAPQNLPAYSF